jgi:hypothetical protein
MKKAALVSVSKKDIWIESDFFGNFFVMCQYTGHEPFEYVKLNYDYMYTCNSQILKMAELIARQLGAVGDIERRRRNIDLSNVVKKKQFDDWDEYW